MVKNYSLPWYKFNTPLLLTVASPDSKFDNLSDADIDSLIDYAIPKNTKKARLRILSFSFKLVEVFLRVVNSFTSFVQCIQFQ